MGNNDAVREGYLVLADISGYTRFVTTTELEHSQSIVGELTELMIHGLAPPLYRMRLRDRDWWSRLKFRLFRPVIRRAFTRSADRLAALLERDGLVTES